MHNNIITQNIILLDKKLIINEICLKTEDGKKYYNIKVTREYEPVICERCGCVVTKTHGYRLRKIKTFFNYDYPTIIYYNQRRLRCDCGKIINEHNTIVGHGKKLSNYLKIMILDQCKYKHSFTTIARMLNVDTMTVINTFMENAGFDRKELSEVICVDEFSANINSDNTYACIIGNPVNKDIIDILPSRHKSFLEEYLSKIPINERLNVKIVNIDMWQAYKEVFSQYCWNAKIAVDPFHWIKHATDCFHKLRRQVEEQSIDPKVRKILRSQWKLFTVKENRLTDKMFFSKMLYKYISNRGMVELGINSDSRLEIAWSLIQTIYRFRDECNYESSHKKLYDIIKSLKESNILEMIEIAKTYENWYPEICNSFLTYGQYNKRTSNAFIEGKNRLCKEIKAFSCGFNNFAIYRARILYISANGNMILKDGKHDRYLHSKRRKR